ncbi:MAG: FAD-binding oxidoreductase [Bacteroidia bacterium]|nr:FAD-binding oxidoreductase [Bacteroidia bacterium]MBP9688330.1 FAD-binding oxidoreductase [Bacteroidia bacterium]
MSEDNNHIIIVGAGIFGLSAAIILAENGFEVTVIEKNLDIMQEASLVNQNRIHYGYHYPRSINTGKEALEGLPSFKQYYGNCINASFKKYYSIAQNGSQLSAAEFVAFCNELNIPLKEEWPDEGILRRENMEACWLVEEPAFDYHILRQNVKKRIEQLKKIRILRNAFITNATYTNKAHQITLNNGYKLSASVIVNASYSGLSDVLKALNLPAIKAHYELLVLPIITLPDNIEPFGVTIMDGPFCSIVPKGFNKGEYILSHVSHSVVQSYLGFEKPEWNSIDGNVEKNIVDYCQTYYPILEKAVIKESWITTKMVLPNQDIDDARPTLVLSHDNNVYSLFSGKVTTCISAAQNLLSIIKNKTI